MNLDRLLNLRISGQRPSGMVFLTLIPDLRKFLSTITPEGDYRGLADLEVCIAFHSSQIEQAFAVADRVLPCKPKSLVFWGLDNGMMRNLVEDGERGISLAAPNTKLSPIVEKIKCR